MRSICTTGPFPNSLSLFLPVFLPCSSSSLMLLMNPKNRYLTEKSSWNTTFLLNLAILCRSSSLGIRCSLPFEKNDATPQKLEYFSGWKVVKEVYVDAWFPLCLFSRHTTQASTGCSLNIVFFSKILTYSGLFPFSVFPSVSVCVHTPGR